MIYLAHGEPFIGFSNEMDFSFVLKLNPNPPVSDFNVYTLIACGRVILFSSVSGESARYMLPVLLMTAHAIG